MKAPLKIICYLTILFTLSCSSSDDVEETTEQNSETTENQNIQTLKDIDGNTYNVVKIGRQLWTTENLNVSHYRNGDPVLQVANTAEWMRSQTGAWSHYDNDPKIGRIHGKLYNWYAITDPRGLIPEGWRLPTREDIQVLKEYLITSGYNYDGTVTGNKIGKSLASKLHWKKPRFPGVGIIGDELELNNKSGFNALPSGRRRPRYTGEDFRYLNETTYLWSSTLGEYNTGIVFRITSNQNSGFATDENVGNTWGHSIRLIKE